jgi:hypothetical protein
MAFLLCVITVLVAAFPTVSPKQSVNALAVMKEGTDIHV